MYSLRQITYKDIEQYDNDYCRRAKDVEVVENAWYYGVYLNEHLVSYFAIQDGPNDGIFIRRGYVLPKYRSTGNRHRAIWQISLNLLEQAAKNKGIRNIRFASSRNPMAYTRLFKHTGFKPDAIEFIKHLED